VVEQAKDVLLGLDAFLWHGNAQHMAILDGECPCIALRCVLQGQGLQHRILEARGISPRQAVELDVVEAAFEDLGGLRHCFTCGDLDVWLGMIPRNPAAFG
jgi:hypothetical protein